MVSFHGNLQSIKKWNDDVTIVGSGVKKRKQKLHGLVWVCTCVFAVLVYSGGLPAADIGVVPATEIAISKI